VSQTVGAGDSVNTQFVEKYVVDDADESKGGNNPVGAVSQTVTTTEYVCIIGL
jgi:hypothetical protein